MIKLQKLQQANKEFSEHPEKPYICPRCGVKKLNEYPLAKRISKHVEGVYICPDCALDEQARLILDDEKLDISEWDFFKKEVQE